MSLYFQRVAIVGVGLLGGSLAKVLRSRNMAGEIVGVGRGEVNLRKAQALGVVDRITTAPGEGVQEADLVVLATPVLGFGGILQACRDAWRPGVIVTDVGSVKAPVVQTAEALLPEGVRFVGGHPIAGGEQSGVEAASDSLFEGARCILTPTPRTDPEALQQVRQLWLETGARVTVMSPQDHDHILAAVSHLPHVVAYALVHAVAKGDGEDILAYAAGGFRDATRIAGSSPEMWRDICLMNRDRLLPWLQRFQDALREMQEAIQRGDGERLLTSFQGSREARQGLEASSALDRGGKPSP